ncbi:MAG TPA: MobF family relaxase [Jatrophihabitans sp.]|jgi:conjugative relaxase-like TrwC/TraI family protein|nr:MobF family relaxase [Jatrophihabitans sp.]
MHSAVAASAESPTSGPVDVTVSIRRMSLGKGYEYLLSSVAHGDGAVAAASPLTRYYAESGTPPGRLLGAGLAGLNGERGVAEGAVVTEQMLFNLLGMLTDPVTGEPLGRRPRSWPTPLGDRIRLRVGLLPADLADAARAGAVVDIEVDENEREKHITRPVAGFDLTFSVPKSVSTVWAVADPATQAVIYEAHLEAIRRTIAYAERHVFFSRSGTNGVVQEDIRGVVATAFDHWDSRAGDPHLHTHVVVANRAQSLDGTWRTLDSRTLFKYVVALSELHEGMVEDLLTARLGYGWDERARRHSPVPRHDLLGVPEQLIEEYSRRSQDIEVRKTELVALFARTHGRQPTETEVLRLRQQATLETRPDKQHRSLAELTEQWRERARPFVGGDTVAWADSLRDRCPLPSLRADALNTGMLRDVALIALDSVAVKRATFTHANVLAEVHRQLHGVRFADPDERLTVADGTTAIALDEALLLTPPGHTPVPERLLRRDGTSKLRHRGAEIFTTREILDAETRLLDAGRSTHGPGVAAFVVADVANCELPGRDHRLAPDQATAVRAIATSGRVLDVLVGPAGTGKTTSLAGLREAWESVHGNGSVIGLAPSAAAAEVLADELGIDTENTAKWLHESARENERLDRMAALIDRLHASTSSPSTTLARRLRSQLGEIHTDYERWTIHPGQLVIIDEASLAGTLALDRIVAQAVDAGAKVLLAGDWAQLCAIEAGGAFAMLVNDRTDPPELTEVRRFQNDWERGASIQLRVGDHAAIATYAAHDRIRSGDRAEMLDALYRAWHDDTSRGLTSLMIAGDHESVAELNLRARADRVAAGEVKPTCIPIADDGVAGVGDRVITRQNDRRFTTGRGWVKNGDAWIVRKIGRNGWLTVQRESGRGKVVLPAAYVQNHVELGYAATAFRAQGGTVDTTHALVGDTTTREALYVSASRGRRSNTIYIDICADPDVDTSEGEREQSSVEQVLRTVLDRCGADISAHATIAHEVNRIDKLSNLVQRLAVVRDAPLDPTRLLQHPFSGIANGIDRLEGTGHSR